MSYRVVKPRRLVRPLSLPLFPDMHPDRRGLMLSRETSFPHCYGSFAEDKPDCPPCTYRVACSEEGCMLTRGVQNGGSGQ